MVMLNHLYKGISHLALPKGKGRLHIFIFHRVLDYRDPLMPHEPDIARFDALIRCISRTYRVIDLGLAVDLMKKQQLPARSACITFDDGYLDNLTNALPILKKYHISPTIFIAFDYIDGLLMWNDVVIESIRGYHGILELEEIGMKLCCSSLEQKIHAINLLLPVIKYMTPGDKQQLVERIKSLTHYNSTRLMMNRNEIQGLVSSGAAVGAHTLSHPILTCIDDDKARQEIRDSKEKLESLLDKAVDLFAYPNGRLGQDYDSRHVAMVEACGYKAAVSTNQRVANFTDSIYELPRFTPWDVRPEKFIARSLYYALKS